MNRSLARFCGALLGIGLLMCVAAPSAYAIHGSTWLVGILADVKKDGGPVRHVKTDENGQFVLDGLEPGDYVIDIDGPSLAAALDKLAPPPEKKSGGSSLSIGGGLFGGSGHSHSDDHGAGPSHGHAGSSGGGMGLGVGIPPPLEPAWPCDGPAP